MLIPPVGTRGVLRVRFSFRASRYNVPEPDLAVVSGPLERWEHEHPSDAMLIIDRIETFADPDPASARWGHVRPAFRGEHIALVALPGLSLAVDAMLPRR